MKTTGKCLQLYNIQMVQNKCMYNLMIMFTEGRHGGDKGDRTKYQDLAPPKNTGFKERVHRHPTGQHPGIQTFRPARFGFLENAGFTCG